MFAKVILACGREQPSDALSYLERPSQMSTYDGGDRYPWQYVNTKIILVYSPTTLTVCCPCAGVTEVSSWSQGSCCTYSPIGWYVILGQHKTCQEKLFTKVK